MPFLAASLRAFSKFWCWSTSMTQKRSEYSPVLFRHPVRMLIGSVPLGLSTKTWVFSDLSSWMRLWKYLISVFSPSTHISILFS